MHQLVPGVAVVSGVHKVIQLRRVDLLVFPAASITDVGTFSERSRVKICDGVHLRSDRQRRRANELQPVPLHARRLGEEAVHVVDGEVQDFGAQLVFPNDFHHPVDEDGPHLTGDLRMVLQEARPWPEPLLGLEMRSGLRSVQKGSAHRTNIFILLSLSYADECPLRTRIQAALPLMARFHQTALNHLGRNLQEHIAADAREATWTMHVQD